jgi:death-on-curing protein
MSARRREPTWLSRRLVEAIQLDQLRQHGGSPGLRDENLLESALARPRMRLDHEPDSDLATLAASCAFDLAKNHAFVDGNERVAFAALFTFLGVNGLELEATENDAVRTILALASGEIDENRLGDWIRAHSRTGVPTKRRRKKAVTTGS